MNKYIENLEKKTLRPVGHTTLCTRELPVTAHTPQNIFNPSQAWACYFLLHPDYWSWHFHLTTLVLTPVPLKSLRNEWKTSESLVLNLMKPVTGFTPDRDIWGVQGRWCDRAEFFGGGQWCSIPPVSHGQPGPPVFPQSQRSHGAHRFSLHLRVHQERYCVSHCLYCPCFWVCQVYNRHQRECMGDTWLATYIMA